MKTRTRIMKTRNIARVVLLAVALVVISGLVMAADKAPATAADKAAMTAFMRMKLAHTMNITEGMALEDYFLVRRSAVKLRDMTQSNIWTKVGQPDYERLSTEYQKNCDALYKVAVDEDLDRITEAYTVVLKNCVDCHRDLRAKHGLDKK